MKSRTLFYNSGVGKNLLRRFWPLWTAYFVALLVLLPLNLAGTDYMSWELPEVINANVLHSGADAVKITFVFGALAAMAMFGYLYNSRSCCMMNALPLRRETMFMTAFPTGLVPMLLADLLTFAITALIYVPGGVVHLAELGQWLAAAAMGNVAFYGMAVFCAMLTGNILVLPGVYIVLNLAAAAAEYAVKSLLKAFLYGYTYDDYALLPFSPIVEIWMSFAAVGKTDGNTKTTEYVYSGMNWLGIYCAAGLLLAFAALLLYRKRRMETAGDTVAIKALKPIFKYCMTFGAAVVFAYLMCSSLLSNTLTGSRLALFAGAILIVGAFIGYYAAEMITRKTLSVFRGNWKGFAVSACVLALLAAACELDVTGYETRVPDAEDVEYVYSLTADGNIKEPENIEAFIELQKHIVSGKEKNENLKDNYTLLAIDYYMKDGSHMGRIYRVDASADAAADPDSDVSRFEDIMNSDEVRAYRNSFGIPLSEDTLSYCEIAYYQVDENGYYDSKSLRLTTEQALELYNDCIEPDIEDGCLGDYFAYSSDEYYNTMTNVYVYYDLHDRTKTDGSGYEYMTFNIQVNSARCLEWLKENTDVEPITAREADPTQELYYGVVG